MPVLAPVDERELLKFEGINSFLLLVRQEQNIVLLLEVLFQVAQPHLLSLVGLVHFSAHRANVFYLRGAVLPYRLDLQLLLGLSPFYLILALYPIQKLSRGMPCFQIGHC